MIPLSEQVRHLIDASGETRYAICKATGIAQSTMSRFMAGECNLSMDSLDALAKHLGWQLTARRPAKKRTSKQTTKKGS